MIQITFNFTDIASAAALFAKLNGHEIGAMQAFNAPAPNVLVHSAAVSANEKTALLMANEAALADTSGAEAPGKPSAAKTARSRPTAAAGPSPSDPSAAAPVTSSAGTTPAAAAPFVTYPDLQKAVLTLHKIDPTAAVPIAKSLGADTFKLLKETQWAEALAAVNAKIAELQAA